MILLFTDFGLAGPYTGQVKAVLQQCAPGVPVIDLFADAPMQNPKAAAYLLAAYAPWFPADSVFLCVVDPGVGGARPPVIVKADGHWFVGPGNGLFEIIMRRAQAAEAWEIAWQPEHLSASFHGRDLFAPVAAMIVNGEAVHDPDLAVAMPAERLARLYGLTAAEAKLAAALAGGSTLIAYADNARITIGTARWYLKQVLAKTGADHLSELLGKVVMTPGTVVSKPIEAARIRQRDWPDDLLEIVYIDHYGNAMTGARASAVPRDAQLTVNGKAIPSARTFGDKLKGAAFWYENSNGLLEIAVNQGRADQALEIAIGTPVSIC